MLSWPKKAHKVLKSIKINSVILQIECKKCSNSLQKANTKLAVQRFKHLKITAFREALVALLQKKLLYFV